MRYYQFNRKEVLQKAKGRYSKEKAAEYYLQTKKQRKKSQTNWYKNLSKKNTKLKSTKGKDTSNWFSTKKNRYKINEFCFYSV